MATGFVAGFYTEPIYVKPRQLTHGTRAILFCSCKTKQSDLEQRAIWLCMKRVLFRQNAEIAREFCFAMGKAELSKNRNSQVLHGQNFDCPRI